MVWKGFFMLALLLVPYALILSNQFSPWACLGFAVLMGLGTAGVGMSVMHDANPPTDAFGRSFYNYILNIENGRAGLEPVILPAAEREPHGGPRPLVPIMRRQS